MTDVGTAPDRKAGEEPGQEAGRWTGLLRRLDDYQQRHRFLGLPFAVWRKFGDDQAGNLAALIAYYAFFSIFPLLLAATTILGYVLGDDPALQQRVFTTTLGQFPIIGSHGSAKPLTGNAVGLIIGLALAIWSGLSVAQVAQQAFNRIYGVPRVDWPGFVPKLLRSIEVIGIGGVGLTASTLLQGMVHGADVYGLNLGLGGVLLAALGGAVLDIAVFVYLFGRLTVVTLRVREVLPGATVAAVAWFALQQVGVSLVNHEVAGAQGTYGTFAVVIGLLFWLYLLAQITLYCAELNAVLVRGLWPRSLRAMISGDAENDADQRAHRSYPHLERQVHNLRVDTRIVEVSGGQPDDAAER
ncbi:MAG TPA: YihY/virulence factor BrkB family protein [Sporichthyaceae bacterium]|jgi:YihY family inner membrane protein|nr:YihY/virulence factor BrkB family protein [Sporichthyaceae bacterium]